jgi:hypothetical protein
VAKKLNARTWARQLPKPVRNGRFYRLGGHVAQVLAGHAHLDGAGITVAMRTLAEETWCTLNEIEEALAWLEEEKWFTRVDSVNGVEWVCNFEIVRSGGPSEIDERLERKRAQGRARWHRLQERRRGDQGVSEVRESALVGCVSEREQLTHPTNELTQATNATNAPNKRLALVGGVRTPGHSPEVPKKEKKEVPEGKELRSADADRQESFFEVASPEKPEKQPKAPAPAHVLADRYYQATDRNGKFIAKRQTVAKALEKYPYEDVERAVDILCHNLNYSFSVENIYKAMTGAVGPRRKQHRPFQSADHDYTDHGGFGA